MRPCLWTLLILTAAWPVLQADEPPDRAPATEAPATTPPPPTQNKSPSPSAKSCDPTGAWLTHLARHMGHLIGRVDPRSAALQVMAVMEAAVELDPDCAEAYYWLYDLQHRLGQTDRAELSLSRYVKLTPRDEAARTRLFEMGLEDQQTSEYRVKFVQTALQAPDLLPSYESLLRYWLARFYFERRDTQRAGQEIENALRLNSMNIPARQLAYEMFGETEAELQRVETALQMISINPTQTRVVWELGEFLDRLCLHKQAQEWLNRAIAMHQAYDSGPVPAAFFQTLAMSYVNSEDYEKARDSAEKAVTADPKLLAAKVLRAHVLTKLGQATDAERELAAVEKYYGDLEQEILAGKNPELSAEAAWFFCYYKPDKDRAMRFAEAAVKATNASDLAKLAYGFALRMNGKTADAEKQLKPLAATDQLAALELASILFDATKKGEAITLLHKAAVLQQSGIAYGLIKAQLEKHGEKPPTVPARPKIIAALDRFHRDVFDFPKRPGEFLKFTLRLDESPASILGPVPLTMRMENAGPFPISLGEGFMVRPLVALTAHVTGGSSATFRDYLQALLNSRSMLLPGDAVEKNITIDVGPLREHLTRHCHSKTTVELTAMLDPVYKDDQLTEGLGTITAGPLRIELKPIDASPGALAGLLNDAENGDMAKKIIAANTIGALLCAEETPSRTTPNKLPVEELRGALAKLLADADWHVKAHALDAASWSKMAGPITNAAAPAVRDDNPVVRMLAIRLFAPQHGEKFRPVLEQLSRSDASRYVRMMALGFLPDTGRTQAASRPPPEAVP